MGKKFQFTMWVIPRILLILIITVILSSLSEITKIFNILVNLFLSYGITEIVSEVGFNTSIIRKIVYGVRGIKEYEERHKPDIIFKLIETVIIMNGNLTIDKSGSYTLFILNRGASGHSAYNIKLILNGIVLKHPHIDIKYKKGEMIEPSNMEIIRSYDEDSSEMPYLDSNEYFSIETGETTIIQYKSESGSQYCSCIKLNKVTERKGKYKIIDWKEKERFEGQLVIMFFGKTIWKCKKCPNKEILGKVKI